MRKLQWQEIESIVKHLIDKNDGVKSSTEYSQEEVNWVEKNIEHLRICKAAFMVLAGKMSWYIDYSKEHNNGQDK